MRRAACLQASTERVRTEAQRPFTRWLVIKAPSAVMGVASPPWPLGSEADSLPSWREGRGDGYGRRWRPV